MQYKIILYNSKFYREIKLDNTLKKGLLIGTSKECQIRFFREHFFTDFIVGINLIENTLVITCEDSIYLKKDNALKSYIQHLQPQDSVTICYDISDTELFKIEFSIDFDINSIDYSRQISIEGQNSITIGGANDNTIKLDDEILGNDYISISKSSQGYMLNQQNIKYSIMINGFQTRQQSVNLNNRDFFSLCGYCFYIRDNMLYTSKEYRLYTRLPENLIQQQKNHLKYPCFVKSARQQFQIPEEKIDILPPKKKPEEPKKSLLATMVPILMSMGMMVLMRMMMSQNKMFALMCAGMGMVSVVMAIYNNKTEGIQHRKDLVKRENDYNKYILQQEEKINKIREKEQFIAKQKYPSLEEHIRFVEDFDARLFEKLKDHEDYLSICLGNGVVESKNQITYKEQEYREVDDPFMDYPEKIHDKYRYIEDMPVVLDMKEKSAIGFIGDRAHLYQMAKNLMLLFATEHYHQDMKVFLIMNKSDKQLFEWARWIKNMSEDGVIRNFAYDEDSNKVVLEYLYSELSNRENLKKEQISNVQNYVVLVYRSEAISNHPISQYVENAVEIGVTFIFFEEYAEMLNPFCEKRIFLHDTQYSGYIQDINNGENIQLFQYPHIPGAKAAEVALKLGCVYVDEVSLESSLTKSITLYELFGIMNAYDLDIEKRWATSKIFETMAAPLGVKSGGDIVYLDLHEKYHGPHGLVAGTTGSGKSEIMQSYILSMATLFHPYEVGFIIIDFKGGGMVNQFRDLPHLNGAITNIDDGEIERSLSSIKAELRKRQRLFAEYDVNHIDDYIKLFKQKQAKTPLPHLILIVDEFAELKSEQPEFMKELISTARIGRSLGVHLILATQKPAGVVNDQIWSNSKFKLCLKVQNKGDSNEVLKSPLAADIREPGRAYLQVGNNEIFQLFQSAYSGAPIPSRKLVEQKKFKISKVELCGIRSVIYEQKPKKDEQEVTQLDELVERIAEYCKEKKIEKMQEICLPPLAEVISGEMYEYTKKHTDIVVPIGIYDDPDNQAQNVLDINITQNQTFIVGSSQTGKTNILQSMIKELSVRYTPDKINIYILDFGTMIMKNFESLSHVGSVIVSTDEDKLKSFCTMMSDEIEKRKNVLAELGLTSFSAYLEADMHEMPQIIIMVDNIGMVKELYSGISEDIMKIVRDGVTLGINVIVTGKQVNAIGYRYLSNFSNRIALFCNDSMEYSSLFDRCRKKINLIPGRFLYSMNKNIYEAQAFMAFPGEKEIDRVNGMKMFVESINDRFKGQKVTQIVTLSDFVTIEEVEEKMKNERILYSIPLGINHETLDVDTLRLDDFPIVGICGEESRDRYLLFLLNWIKRNKSDNQIQTLLMDQEKDKMIDDISQLVDEYILSWDNLKEKVIQISEINAERKARALKKELLENEPLLLVIINDRNLYTKISEDKEVLEKIKQILLDGKMTKISFVLSDIPNEKIRFNPCELIKIFASVNSIIFMKQFTEQKLVDVSPKERKKYSSSIKENDLYFKLNGYIGKYRFPILD